MTYQKFQQAAKIAQETEGQREQKVHQYLRRVPHEVNGWNKLSHQQYVAAAWKIFKSENLK